MYLCVSDIDFASFYYFPILFWNCPDRVVIFILHFINKKYIFCSCRDFDIKTVFVLYSYLFKEYTLHTVAMKTKWLSVPESLFIELNQYTVTGSFISNHLFSKYSPEGISIQFSYFSLLIKKSYYNISIYCFNLVPSITKLYVNRSSVSFANIWLGLIYGV